VLGHTNRSSHVVMGLLTLATLCGCRASKTTDTRSSQFPSQKEKLEFLSRYMALKSSVEAAEFHVVYHDNSGGLVPGPSDADVQAVLKVRHQDIGLWVSGMRLRDPEPAGVSRLPGELDWGYALLPNSPRWHVSSRPAVFAAGEGTTLVAVFEAEGIVMKRIRQH